MTDLFTNASLSLGFITSSFVQTPNKVYGLLQCYGNLPAGKCSDCAHTHREKKSLMELYANDIGGLVLMDDYFLLYDNYNFILVLDTNLYVLWNPSNVSGNMDDFQATTSSHLSNLSIVVYDPVNRRSTYYSISQNFYEHAQFGRYLSIEDYKTFLVKAGNTMEDYCSVDPGGSALLGSSVVRFESYPFFNTTRLSSPESSPRTPTTYSPSIKG